MEITDLVRCAAPFPTSAFLADKDPDYAVQHALQIIEQKEPSVRAWVDCAAPIDHSEAVESDGALAGVPFGVKDVIDVAGFPTLCGSGASDDHPAAFNAACVDALVRAGAVPLGKTVTAEYAFRHPGPTRNPWHLDHTPGGSSSGSAAAVAAGMVPLALSTQTGGSIIRPAAYCGVLALKPSFGLISRDGLQLTCDSLDTIGWHGSDMDWMLRCAAVLLPARDAAAQVCSDGIKVAVVDTAPDGVLEDAGRHALDRAVSAFRQMGAQCEVLDLAPKLQLLSRAHGVIMKYEFARNLGPVARVRNRQLSVALLKNVEEGWAIPHSVYLEMLTVQQELRLQWSSLSDGADLIVTPSASGPAPAGHTFTGTPAFNKCWTVLGWPCLHVPVLTDGPTLPTGVQLVGPWHSDFQVLAHGSNLEAMLRRGLR